jgi:hypothetical protein
MVDCFKEILHLLIINKRNFLTRKQEKENKFTVKNIQIAKC